MKRLALSLILLLAAGCCTVDHDQQARTAQQRITALERVPEVPDEELTPDAFRRMAAVELKTWRVVKARSLEADELPEGAR